MSILHHHIDRLVPPLHTMVHPRRAVGRVALELDLPISLLEAWMVCSIAPRVRPNLPIPATSLGACGSMLNWLQL